MPDEIPVAKADDENQLVFGWANVAIRKDGTGVLDSQGDVVPVDELEFAAYDFVLESRESGDMHDGGPAHGALVESMVFTPEKLEKMGLPADALPSAWWVGFHIPDRAEYDRVKKSRLMFSIEGSAVREPL